MRILYLEDDPLDAEALRRALANLRPEIALSIASSPRTALARLQEAGAAAPFDAVVVDVSLPEMNGFEFIDRLASWCSRAPSTASTSRRRSAPESTLTW